MPESLILASKPAGDCSKDPHAAEQVSAPDAQTAAVDDSPSVLDTPQQPESVESESTAPHDCDADSAHQENMSHVLNYSNHGDVHWCDLFA